MFAIYNRHSRAYLTAPGSRVPELFPKHSLAERRKSALVQNYAGAGGDPRDLEIRHVKLVEASYPTP